MDRVGRMLAEEVGWGAGCRNQWSAGGYDGSSDDGSAGSGVCGERSIAMGGTSVGAQESHQHDGYRQLMTGASHTEKLEAFEAVDAMDLLPPDLDAEMDRMANSMADLTSGGRDSEPRELHQILGISPPLLHQTTNNVPKSITPVQAEPQPSKQLSGLSQSSSLTAIRAAKSAGHDSSRASSRTTKRANSARRVRLSNNIAVIPSRPAKLTRRSHLTPVHTPAIYTPPLSDGDESDTESIVHGDLSTPGMSSLLSSYTEWARRCLLPTDDRCNDDQESLIETILFPKTAAQADRFVGDDDADALEASEVEDTIPVKKLSGSARGTATSAKDAGLGLVIGPDYVLQNVGPSGWYDRKHEFSKWTADIEMSDMDVFSSTPSEVPSQMSPSTSTSGGLSPSTSVFRHFSRVRSVDEVEADISATASSATSPVHVEALQAEYSPPSGPVSQLPTPSSFVNITATKEAQANGVGPLLQHTYHASSSHAVETFAPYIKPRGGAQQSFTTRPYSQGRNPPPVRSAFQPASPKGSANHWQIGHAPIGQTAPGYGHVTPSQPAQVKPRLPGSDEAYRNTVSASRLDVEALAQWFTVVVITRLACPLPARGNQAIATPNVWGGNGLFSGALQRSGGIYRSTHAGRPTLSRNKHLHLHAFRPSDPFGVLGRHVYCAGRITPDSRLCKIIYNLIMSLCLPAERVIAAAWYLDGFPVHDADGAEGIQFRRLLHANISDKEQYPLELRLATVALMIADIGVADADDGSTPKIWARSSGIPHKHLFELQMAALVQSGYSVVFKPSVWLDHARAVHESAGGAFGDNKLGADRFANITYHMVRAAYGVVDQAEVDLNRYATVRLQAPGADLPFQAAKDNHTPAAIAMRKSRSYAEYDGAADFPVPHFDDCEDDDMTEDLSCPTAHPFNGSSESQMGELGEDSLPTAVPFTTASSLRQQQTDVLDAASIWTKTLALKYDQLPCNAPVERRPDVKKPYQRPCHPSVKSRAEPTFAARPYGYRSLFDGPPSFRGATAPGPAVAKPSKPLPPLPLSRWQIAPPVLHDLHNNPAHPQDPAAAAYIPRWAGRRGQMVCA